MAHIELCYYFKGLTNQPYYTHCFDALITVLDLAHCLAQGIREGTQSTLLFKTQTPRTTASNCLVAY